MTLEKGLLLAVTVWKAEFVSEVLIPGSVLVLGLLLGTPSFPSCLYMWSHRALHLSS